jgi:anti-sigma regulatory factor (Ser/Thr protein kinase)
MATTRSILRSEAPRLIAPGRVLARANELLAADMPTSMFVTCFYAVLDPRTGRLRFANAGQNLPYVRGGDGVRELHARGMPLGLMPGMAYDEEETVLAPGQAVLLHSDGLGEAHGGAKDMFGFPRVRSLLGEHEGSGQELIDSLLSALDRFTGAAWEQEDDITLVTVARAASAPDLRLLSEFSTPSVTGNERLVMERVGQVVGDRLHARRLERLRTAVSEAAMNAIEHGNRGRPELPVQVQVLASDEELVVRVTDQGGGQPIPEAETPDLDAKIAGLQKTRGWGLFLIKNMVDDLRVVSDDTHHTVELVMHVRGETAPGAAIAAAVEGGGDHDDHS